MTQRNDKAEGIFDLYLRSTPKSRSVYEQSINHLPGGNTRTTLYHDPYPFYAARGEGCRIYDLDGNVRVDFLNNYTSLILGHAHPKVVEAASEQIRQGTSFGCPTALEVRLADMLKERLPAIDLIRFANSGTEATMMAIRAARAFTGRDKIAKFEGGYHGTHDIAVLGAKAASGPAGTAGSSDEAVAGPGLPRKAAEDVVILPFNRTDETARIVNHYRDALAAIIVEPVMGAAGIIIPRDGFLQFLREITKRHGILLIFDEVMTFRLSYHGAQGRFGVTPDLTALGKIIGGGFPAGAFGGRGDIMAAFDPRRVTGRVDHGGTFNANPVTMAAGIATLTEMTPRSYEELETLTVDLREKLLGVFSRHRIPAQVNQIASLFNIHFTAEEVSDYRSGRASNVELLHQVCLAMLNHGIFLASRGMGCLSTPISSTEVDAFVRAMDLSLDDVKE